MQGSQFQSVDSIGADASLESRAAVLADAEALLTCYGVGEETGSELLHAVVELCFTSSVRFLQPGLLLKVVRCQSTLAVHLSLSWCSCPPVMHVQNYWRP